MNIVEIGLCTESEKIGDVLSSWVSLQVIIDYSISNLKVVEAVLVRYS